ncbi:MAG: TrlF family AAA-like ATPase [Candidatus Hodarchaeota archaeon]
MAAKNTVHRFIENLYKNCPKAGAQWTKTDCHFHSSASHDCSANVEEMIDALVSNNYHLTVITDHTHISNYEKARELAFQRGLVLLPGCEVYAKVPAIQAETGKTAPSYFHLLLIFDPDVPKLVQRFENLITKNRPEILQDGSRKDFIIDLLTWPFEDFARKTHEESNALLIPAHLHTDPRHPEKSRSIDDIFVDELFLNWIVSCKFDALEVTDPKTADFFDGHHTETKNLKVSCIRSSDAHKPNEIGRRECWLKMEEPSFEGIRLALQDRDTRVSLMNPNQNKYHKIIGTRVQGRFFKDTWVRFNDDLNCLVGAKGKGKSALLESVRFALNLDVPEIKGSVQERQKFRNRNEALLNNILGSGGKVECLVESQSGIKYLFRRSRKDSAPTITSETDGIEKPYYDISSSFHSQFYGWEELTSCSEEMNLLTDVFDVHFEPIDTEEGRLSYSDIAVLLKDNVRDLNSDLAKVQEKRNALIEYEATESTINSLEAKLESESKGQKELSQCIACQEICTSEESLLDSMEEFLELKPVVMLSDESESQEPIAADQGRQTLELAKQSPETRGDENHEEDRAKEEPFQLPLEVKQKRESVIGGFGKLVNLYDEISEIVQEKWKLTHPSIMQNLQNAIKEYREGLSKTADDLRRSAGIEKDSDAEAQLDKIRDLQTKIAEKKKEIEGQSKEVLKESCITSIKDYTKLCEKRTQLYGYISDGRAAIAQKLTEEHKESLKAEFKPRCLFDDYRQKLRSFFLNSGLQYNEIIDTLISKSVMPEKLCELIVNWDEPTIMEILDISKEQADKLHKHTFSDLVSKLKPFHDICVDDLPEVKMLIDEKAINEEDKYRIVSKLSAGERSTTVLPLVTHGTPNPLIVDQPEDDLDNTYIHENFVHGLLRKTKGRRQYIFATHNANIPVLGDAENIFFMNATREEGWIEKSGSTDLVSQEIIEILEGGREAFTNRFKKYKIPAPQI